jgi:hypothetical protein
MDPISSEIDNGKTHLKKYLEEWDRLVARSKQITTKIESNAS